MTVPATQRGRHIKAFIRRKGKSSRNKPGVPEPDAIRLFKKLLASYLTSASLLLQPEVPDPITFDGVQSRSALSKEISP